MGEVTRSIFNFSVLFGVHQNDKFGGCLNRCDVPTHTRAFWSVAGVALLSIAITCLHLIPNFKRISILKNEKKQRCAAAHPLHVKIIFDLFYPSREHACGMRHIGSW